MTTDPNHEKSKYYRRPSMPLSRDPVVPRHGEGRAPGLILNSSVIIIAAAPRYVQLLSFLIPNDYCKVLRDGESLELDNRNHYIAIKAMRLFDLGQADDMQGHGYQFLQRLVGRAKRTAS